MLWNHVLVNEKQGWTRSLFMNKMHSLWEKKKSSMPAIGLLKTKFIKISYQALANAALSDDGLLPFWLVNVPCVETQQNELNHSVALRSPIQRDQHHQQVSGQLHLCSVTWTHYSSCFTLLLSWQQILKSNVLICNSYSTFLGCILWSNLSSIWRVESSQN